MGTELGLYRLLGNRFHHVRLAEEVVEAPVTILFDDRERRTWVGTMNRGVHCLDEQIRTFGEQDGLTSRKVNALALQDGRLLAGTEGGLSRWDGTSFQSESSVGGEPVTSLLVDQQGGLMSGLHRTIYTSMVAVEWFDGEGQARAAEVVGQAMRFNYVATTAIVQDAEGVFWIGCLGGLIRFDGQEATTLTKVDGLRNDKVLALELDGRGRLWIGTQGGLSCYDGTSFKHYEQIHGLPGSVVNAAFCDSQGDLWFGCEGGLVRYHDGIFLETFRTVNGLPSDSISAITEGSDGRLWIGTTDRGVAIFDGTAFVSLSRETGLSGNQINDILHDEEGNVWIATDRGLTRYRPRSTPPEVRITGVAADRLYQPEETVELIGKHPRIEFEFEGVTG